MCWQCEVLPNFKKLLGEKPMEKQYVVLYGSYSTAYPKPANLRATTIYQFGGVNNKSFVSVDAALEAIKSVPPVQGYGYFFEVVELVAAVETKPVIETVVTRY